MALLQAVQALLGSVEEEWEFEAGCCLAVALAVTQAVVSRPELATINQASINHNFFFKKLQINQFNHKERKKLQSNQFTPF